MSNGDFHQSIQSVIQDEKPTVRKSLVIGLGGSGMKGVLAVKKWVESNLPTEAFRYMRWIGIDTTDIETSIEGKGGRYRFPSNQFFQEERRMLYVSAPTPSELSLEFLREKFKNDPVYSWLPNPDVYDISTRAGQGANQTRALGRLAFYFNELKIRSALMKERDRLSEISNDPKYFQLLDVKEGSDKIDEDLIFTIQRGENRYYFQDKIPQEHTIVRLKPHPSIRAILSPHTEGDIELKDFPKDEKGHYFEINGKNFHGQQFSFRALHMKRRAQISIFLTCSIVGGTGNGMIMDMAALVKDVFKDYWPQPRIYGILVLPSAFKRVVYNKNARGNAYAALKEIDYFMSGNSFRAEYPSGNKVEVPDRLFDEGMLYLLDVENMAGNSLQGRDQVQELTGQFIATFVASTVGGAIEERMVNDSTRASIYLPKDSPSKRKAAYNSFGISRVIYPVPILTEYGYKITAVNIAKSFFKEVQARLLLETIGDINRGLVRALRLNCRLIFERMYPDYEMDIEVEFKSYYKRLESAWKKGDQRGVVLFLDRIIRDYGKEEQEKIKRNLLIRIKKRYQLELDKMKSVLKDEVYKYIQDPQKGFFFAEQVANLIIEKIDLYQKRYYQERVALARHSTEELESVAARIEKEGLKDIQLANAVIDMTKFNFAQLVYETMLTAAEDFSREFKAVLFQIKNDEINSLKEKVLLLVDELNGDVQKIRFNLLEQKNPLFFYLINEKEIDGFLQSYFYQKLSIEDLCNDVNFVAMDREDDKHQLIETYLLSTHGLEILDLSTQEMNDMIQGEFGDILDKSVVEIKELLYAEQTEDGYSVSDTAMLRVDIQNLNKKLFKVIHERFKGFNFENISIKQLLDEKRIPVQKLLEKLDTYSRPYTYLNASGLNAMEYYRTITNFKLQTYEEGDNPDSGSGNDLPSRMDHYRKRESAVPNISVETFEVPNMCKPYEMISIGMLLGFPIYKLDSLKDSARDYHILVSEKSHPLHLFNHPDFDGKYFPDPMREMNYLNPARLWNGLLELELLTQQNDGNYHYDELIHGELREMEAREQYKQVVLDLADQIEHNGGLENMSLSLMVEAVHKLAMLARNPKDGSFQFRREYSLVIRDILDGDGTADRAREQKMSKDRYIERHVKNPSFAGNDDLLFFLESEFSVREFLQENIKEILDQTRENISAGAAIDIPRSQIEQINLPVFKDHYEFYDYFERKGSLEWQNLLKSKLVEKLDKHVFSARFRLESDPTLMDRTKVGAFLDDMQGKLPEIVIWEVKVANKIIK